jgi:tRNA (guanosine-2'-O-)-methyltransferase
VRQERFRRLREVLSLRQPDLTVLLEQVSKPWNVSAILRGCDAVGVLEAHVVLPGQGLALNDAVSAGTRKWIRIHRHEDVGAATHRLRDDGFHVVAADPSPGAQDYREVDYTRPTAFLLGAEKYGVSEAGRSDADARVALPMRGMVRSLNVSVAAALVLYEAQRQREAAGMYEDTSLDAETFRRRLFEWAYPRQAARHRARGVPYPRLDPNGRILPA